MKKKFLLFTTIFMMLFQLSFSGVQAASPSTSAPEVCGAPSREMILYQEFQAEMATRLLGGDFGEKLFQADVSVVGFFTSKTLKIPNSENQAVDALISSTWKAMKRLGQATLTTFVLLSLAASSVVTSNLEGIPMLFQDRAIVREWKSLLDIETRLMQVAYFMGKTRNIMSPLDDVSGLREVVEKYVQEGLFTGNLVGGGMSYYDILRDLGRMNAAMKYFIAFNTTKTLEIYDYSSLFRVTFNRSGLQQMQEYYTPVRFFKGFSPCNAPFKKMLSGIKQAFSSNKSVFNESKAIIADASKRLAVAMAETAGMFIKKDKEKTLAEKYFTDFELQQLRTVYGVDTTRMVTRDAPRWKTLLAIGPNAKQSWKNALKGVKTLWDDTKKVVSQARGGAVATVQKIKD